MKNNILPNDSLNKKTEQSSYRFILSLIFIFLGILLENISSVVSLFDLKNNVLTLIDNNSSIKGGRYYFLHWVP